METFTVPLKPFKKKNGTFNKTYTTDYQDKHQ